MRNLILILSLFVLMGCKTTEEKARNYYLDNKAKLAELCVDCFGKNIPEPIYIKGDKVIEIKRDTTRDTTTVYVEVDCPDGSKVKKKLPPTEKIEIEVLRVDTVYQDTWQTLALVEALKHKLFEESIAHTKTKTLLEEETKDKKMYRLGFFVCFALIIGFALFKIFIKR